MYSQTHDTLLSVVLDGLTEEQISGSTITRLQLICSFKARQSSTQQAEQLLSDALSTSGAPNALTGLVLVFPTCLMLLLEGHLQMLQAALRNLCSQHTSGLLQDTRVLMCMEGVPCCACNALYTAYIPSSSAIESADAADTMQVIKLASSVTAAARKVAESLSVLAEADVQRQLSSLASYHEDLPAAETLLSLVASPELPSGKEWLDMYSGNAPEMPLDSEVTWPVPRPLVMA